MTEDQLANDIVAVSSGMDGFLVQLRTTNTFNEATYDRLIALLRTYYAHISTGRFIDRRVAGCLLELELQLLLQIIQRESGAHSIPIKQRLEYAHREVTDLNAAMFWGERAL